MGSKTNRPARRNPVVRTATVLRKGGAHGKSRKAERKEQKDSLRKATRKEIRHDIESPFFLPAEQDFAAP